MHTNLFTVVFPCFFFDFVAAAEESCASSAVTRAWVKDATEDVMSGSLQLLQFKGQKLEVDTEMDMEDDRPYPGQAKNCSTTKDGLGNSADLDEYGYLDVALGCCQPQMEMFINRILKQMNLKVCDEGGVKGLAPWFICDNIHSLKYLKERIHAGLPLNASCPFAVHESNECPKPDAVCLSGEVAANSSLVYFWQLYDGKDVDPNSTQDEHLEDEVSSTTLHGKISDEGGFGGWTTQVHDWHPTQHVVFKNDTAANLLARLVDNAGVKTYLKSKWQEFSDCDVNPDDVGRYDKFKGKQHHDLMAQKHGYAAWVQHGDTVHYKRGSPLELFPTVTRRKQWTAHLAVPQGFALPADEVLPEYGTEANSAAGKADQSTAGKADQHEQEPAEKAPAEKAAAEKEALEKTAAEKESSEKATTEKEPAEKRAADKAAVESAAGVEAGAEKSGDKSEQHEQENEHL